MIRRTIAWLTGYRRLTIRYGRKATISSPSAPPSPATRNSPNMRSMGVPVESTIKSALLFDIQKSRRRGASSDQLAEYRGVDAIQELGHAAETGDVERVARLLREGVPVDARNTVGRPRTALDRAIWAEQTDVVRLLLASGADPDQPIGEYGEDTPVRFAAPRGMTDILRLLLEAGADPDGRIEARDQAPGLVFAAGEGLAAIVEVLLDHGASINHIEGGTPLAAAAAGGWPIIVRMLLDRGAIPTAEALELAERNSARYRSDSGRLAGFSQVITMLKAAGA